jgi:putative PIN family toxin of toxin-antitoxin system
MLRDAKDLVVLEAAVEGNAGGIITGDRDLLVLECAN